MKKKYTGNGDGDFVGGFGKFYNHSSNFLNNGI